MSTRHVIMVTKNLPNTQIPNTNSKQFLNLNKM